MLYATVYESKYLHATDLWDATVSEIRYSSGTLKVKSFESQIMKDCYIYN